MYERTPILQEEVASCLKEMKLSDDYSPKFEVVINRIVDWCLQQSDILQHVPRDTPRPQNYFRFCIKHKSIRSVGVFLAVYPRKDTVAKLEVDQDSLRGIDLPPFHVPVAVRVGSTVTVAFAAKAAGVW